MDTKITEKRTRLQANRAALIQQHTALTEQLTQTTAGIHQIDGALAILGELETESAVTHPNGVTAAAIEQ